MQLKVSKHVVVLFVLTAVMASILIFVGCEKQAKTGAQGVQAAPKTSIAGEVKTGSTGKVVDANAVKTCPMKGKKPADVKKAKSVSDANAAAKRCEKMMCAIGDGKAANKSICTEYKGKRYCFCCEGCKKQFEKDPDKYAGKCK